MIENKQYSPTNLIWIDLEMTGLEIKTDTIIEIAAVITDNKLNIINQQKGLVIKHSKAKLDKMNEWCIKTHTANNLIQDALKSNLSLQEAEKIILDFISKYVPAKTSPICGNSIHNDKIFINKYMPKISNYLHYRQIDVSSFKEMFKHYDPNYIYKKKDNIHRALEDILESINELKFYCKYIFNK